MTQSLLERVQAASGPDREIDREIGFALDGWRKVDLPQGRRGGSYVTHHSDRHLIHVPDDAGGTYYADHPGSMYPSVTESIDAALALVERKLPGWLWQVKHGFGYEAMLWSLERDGDDYPPATGTSQASAPLAILGALLTALEAEKK